MNMKCSFCGSVEKIDAACNVTVSSCKRCQGFQLWQFNRANEKNIAQYQYQIWYETEYRPAKPVIKIQPPVKKRRSVQAPFAQGEIWRHWIRESYLPDPAPEPNPVYQSWLKLPEDIQQLCQKPVEVVQNRQPILDETVDDPDLEVYAYQNDCPANLSFEAQGSEITNQYLDAGQEGRYLREYCVQRAGANHFLHLKNLTDLRSVPQHRNPEYFAKTLDIPFDLAVQFVEALKSLSFDRKAWLKLYHGNKALRGMKDMAYPEILDEIDKFISTAELLDNPDQFHRTENFPNGYPGTITWINYLLSTDVEKDLLEQYFKNFEEQRLQDDDEEIDDGMDRKTSNNPYSTNRLYDGKDTLSWEFQRMIETADEAKLDQLKAGMYPQKKSPEELWETTKLFMQKYDTVPSEYSSRKKWSVEKNDYVPATSTGTLYKKPKFHYFTPGMKSHFWTLYHARRKELREQMVPVKDLSHDAKIAMDWIKSLGKGKATCDVIYAASAGKSYSLYGLNIAFTQKLDQHEVNTLWQAYRAL
jgi:hypothetical protein